MRCLPLWNSSHGDPSRPCNSLLHSPEGRSRTADVPYRVGPYEDLLRDPRDTIDFDQSVNDVARLNALHSGANATDIERLERHDGAIRDGIGVHRSPAEYGAVPTDPSSHSPGFSGVQQPGMMGQVKEGLITRAGVSERTSHTDVRRSGR